jgi:hypothetical protein
MPLGLAITSFIDRLPRWAVLLLIVAAALLVSVLYMWPAYVAFPMDDTYIHFVYANNLVQHGRLIFNFLDERGVGTTSILWVLLLALGSKIGLSMPLLAKALGVTSLATVAIAAYLLLHPVWGRTAALAGALLLAISGNMVWFALSGMETMLFVGLGMTALLAYRSERWVLLGLLLGLLGLTRPEGLALGLAIALVELIRHRKLTAGLLVAGLVCAALCLPWFAYLYIRSGSLVSTSGLGKQLSTSVAIAYLLQRMSAPSFLAGLSWLIYVASWIVYLALFTLGGMALPAPHVDAGNVAGNTYPVSVWAPLAWIVALALLGGSLRRLGTLRRWRAWMMDWQRRPLLALVLWIVLHNLCYMAFLPVPGTASRYGAINHVVLWLGLLAGLVLISNRSRLRLLLSAAVAVIAVANSLYWNGVYHANIDHMQKVRIAAAHYIKDTIPATQLCAAFDVGAMRYFSARPILDLGGLIDPSAGQVYESGSADRYLLDHGVSCLVLPGRSGAADEGWFDFASIMGLTQSRLLTLEPIAAFEIDHERWLQGYLPTANYQASVAIYRLLPLANH